MASRFSKAKEHLLKACELVGQDAVQDLLEEIFSAKSKSPSSSKTNTSPNSSDDEDEILEIPPPISPRSPAKKANQSAEESTPFSKLSRGIIVKFQDSWNEEEKEMESISISKRKVNRKKGVQITFKVNLVNPSTTVVLVYPPALLPAILRAHISDFNQPYDDLPEEIQQRLSDLLMPQGLCKASAKMMLSVIKRRFRKVRGKNKERIKGKIFGLSSPKKHKEEVKETAVKPEEEEYHDSETEGGDEETGPKKRERVVRAKSDEDNSEEEEEEPPRTNKKQRVQEDEEEEDAVVSGDDDEEEETEELAQESPEKKITKKHEKGGFNWDRFFSPKKKK